MHVQGGSIVNMGSIEGVRGNADNACYAASRGAVMAWTRSVALAWAQYKIRVNAFAPVAHTPLADKAIAAMDDSQRAAVDAYMKASIPLTGRMGDPARDIAPVLAFLAGDASCYMTGQVIAADGGFMMLGS
jgi:NAD(P)-dependent dehydrogenase (short-subunit alcohol dehydrogenase family)